LIFQKEPAKKDWHQARHCRKRHLPTHRQNQCLEQQGEAIELSDPLGLDLANLAVRKVDAWHTHFQETLVLKEIQVAQPFYLAVVHGIHPGLPRIAKTRPSSKINLDRQLFLRFIEIDLLNKPRRLNTQSGGEKLVGHHDGCPFGMAESVILPDSASSSMPSSIAASRVRCAGLRPPLTRQSNPLTFQ
jgi:hypothetical protein